MFVAHWRVSDDTVLHLAVGECLVQNKSINPSPPLYFKLVDYYKNGMKDMKGKLIKNVFFVSLVFI